MYGIQEVVGSIPIGSTFKTTGTRGDEWSAQLMSEGFDQRQEGFETKFKLEEEQRFRANARRNKMLGRWAAERMGLSGPETEEYVLAVVKSDFEEAGDDDVFRKVKADLDEKGKAVPDDELRATMDRLCEEACR